MARRLTPADEMRLFKGLALQPFLAAAMTLVLYPVIVTDRYLPAYRDSLGPSFAVAVYFGVAALIVTLACVFPTVVWLVKRRRVHLLLALAFGLAFGNAPMLLAAADGGGGFRLHVFASILGLIGAAVFWLVSIRGRDFSREPSAA